MTPFHELTWLLSSNRKNRGRLRLDIDEASTLYKYVSSLPENSRVVEIGRFKGGSTILIASALPKGGSLVSIDINSRYYELIKADLSIAGLGDKVELVIANSQEYEYDMRIPSNHIDLLFIDGDHSYEGARADHMKWGRRVKAGGHIIHHDMAKEREDATQIPDLKRLFQEILINQKSCATLVEEKGSMAIFRRNGSCWKSWRVK